MARRVPLSVRNPRLFQARASGMEYGLDPAHAQSMYLKYGVTDFSEYDEEVYDAPTFGKKFGDKYNEDGSLVERCEGCNKPTCICEEEAKSVVSTVTETVSDAATTTVETTTGVAKAVVNAPIEVTKAVGKGTVAAATMTKDATKTVAQAGADATIAVATAPFKGAKAVTDAIGITTKKVPDDVMEDIERDINSRAEIETPAESEDAEPEELTWNQFRTMHRGYKRGQISSLWKDYKREKYDPYSKDSKKKLKRNRRRL